MQYFYGFFNKRKGYPVTQKCDVIQKNRGNNWHGVNLTIQKFTVRHIWD